MTTLDKDCLLFGAGLIGLLAGVAFLVWVGFALVRWVNWEFGYESMVQEAICASVKPEYLIQGTCE